MNPQAITLLQHLFAGAAAIGILAHAVNTFPTPKNVYGQWLLGVVKYIVGQRLSAMNSFNGLQTEVTAVTSKEKEALRNGSIMKVAKLSPSDILRPIPEEDQERT